MMAKMQLKSGRGPIARCDVRTGQRFTLRADGAIVRQARIDGTLEGPTIMYRIAPEFRDYKVEAVAAFERYLRRLGWQEAVEVLR